MDGKAPNVEETNAFNIHHVNPAKPLKPGGALIPDSPIYPDIKPTPINPATSVPYSPMHTNHAYSSADLKV